jgi:ATP-dependent DNA helicase DinG
MPPAHLPAPAASLPARVRAAFDRLAARLPGYELRPSQLAMAEEIARTLEGDGPVVLEAPTGTGKTLAYLVPALLSGLRVVVSTGTKTLQEQLLGRDLVMLAEHLGAPFRASYLKGRANFLCLRRFEEMKQRLFPHPRLGEVASWAGTTTTGDRAELELADDDPLWRELSATSETTLGRRCPHYDDCFTTRMRRTAAESDLVVVNHHLYFADLSLRARLAQSSTGGPGRGPGSLAAAVGAQVIPTHDAVIFDEAHQLEDVATDAFGVTLSSARLSTLARDARVVLAGPTGAGLLPRELAERMAGDLERDTAAFAGLFPIGAGPETVRSPFPTHLIDGPPALARSQALDDALALLSARAATLLDATEEEVSGHAWREPLRRLGERAAASRFELAAFLPPRPRDHIYWLETRQRGFSLRASPLELGSLLGQHLYSQTQALALTSATLSAGGRFDFLLRTLGLDDGAAPAVTAAPASAAATEPPTASTVNALPVRTVRLESPFDYARQAILYLPPHLPDPREAGFSAAAAAAIAPLVQLTRGRAFLLFTSHRVLHEVKSHLLPRLPYPILTQGERPRTQLLDDFRAATTDDGAGAVLFGSTTFWEGVDVVGPALSLVVIDKLPFVNPKDPVVEARVGLFESRGQNGFHDYQVPQAALQLAQGFGRLIRSRSDRGIVCILDRRLTRMAYGRTFLSTLPDCPRTSDLDGVRSFWEQTAADLPPP